MKCKVCKKEHNSHKDNGNYCSTWCKDSEALYPYLDIAKDAYEHFMNGNRDDDNICCGIYTLFKNSVLVTKKESEEVYLKCSEFLLENEFEDKIDTIYNLANILKDNKGAQND